VIARSVRAAVLKQLRTWPDLDHRRVLDLLTRAIDVDLEAAIDQYWLSPQEGWHIVDDFPCARPPWPTLWCEWQMPPVVHADGDLVALAGDPRGPARFGVLGVVEEVGPELGQHGVVAGLQVACATGALGLVAEAQLRLGDDGRVVLVPLPDTGIAASPRASTTACWLPTVGTAELAQVVGPHLGLAPDMVRVCFVNPLLSTRLACCTPGGAAWCAIGAEVGARCDSR
jgi:hypothetical protein